MRQRKRNVGFLLVSVRRIVSLMFLVLMTAGFISGASVAALATKIVKNVQIVPMVFIGAFAALGIWLVATIIFGRIYCSSVCPLGTLQDLPARLFRWTPKMAQAHKYKFVSSQAPMQYTWSTIVILLVFLSQPLLLVAFDPYSLCARALAAIIPASDNVQEYVTVVRGVSLGVMATMIVFIPVVIVAFFRGRSFCNTFCPVGGALSAVSKLAIMKIDINTDLCVRCNKCVDVCKARCINPENYTTDTPRCVVCFNCIKVCPNSAITYTTHRHRLSTPMMMSTTNNLKITSTKDETISRTAEQNND